MNFFPQESLLQKQAVDAMQHNHTVRILESGIMRKIFKDIEGRNVNRPIGKEVKPIVLSSCYGDTKHLFISLQLAESDQIRSKVAQIGSVDLVTGIYAPNIANGYEDQDCRLVNELALQAEELQRIIAPSYSTELGIFREAL